MKIIRAILSRPYLTLLWTAVVLLLTLTPAIDMPLTPAWEFLSFDTAAHAAVFAVLAAVAWPWVRTWAARPGLVVLVGCVALGALIEVLQYAMHQGRHAEWSDLLSDSIGVVVVLALIGLGRMGRRRLTQAAVLVAASTLAASAQPASPRPTDAPDLTRARRTIEELASEKMHGRGYVQQGEHVAAAYLRGRLRQLGLQPLAPNYTQPFTLDVNTFPGKVQLQLVLPSQGTSTKPTIISLRPGVDFIAAPDCPSLSQHTYYLDYPDTLAYQQQLASVTVALEGRLDAIYNASLLLRQRDKALLHTPAGEAVAAKYAGLLHPHIEIVPKLTASLAPEQSSQPQLQVLSTSLPTWATSNRARVIIQLDAQLLHNYQTQNLTAVVRGSAQPDSFLVVTAHYDHLGMMGKNAYFPGANDNASGVALLLELAAHYARPENRPRYSVAFLLFGAEEAGLVGSAYFVQHPLLPLPRIKFLVNLDLLGTGEEGATVVNGKVYEAAFQRLTALNDAQHFLPKLGARGRAANSDHYPFSEAGVPAFFMYTRGGSTAYHDVNDRPAALSLAGFTGAYGLVRTFLDGLGAGTAKSPSR